jgi:hypothetical protein
MDLNKDPRELEQKIEQATRIASHIGDEGGAVEGLDCGTEAKVAAAWGGKTRNGGDQDTGPRNLGRERTPCRPRPGTLASGRVPDRRVRTPLQRIKWSAHRAAAALRGHHCEGLSECSTI